jgi:hypothetical protein
MKNLILLSMMGIFIAMQGLPGLAEAKSSGTTDTGPGCGWGKIWWAQDAGAKTKGVQIPYGNEQWHVRQSDVRHQQWHIGLHQ